MKIKFIPQEEIDKTKWNSCVHYAINGNIFGYMWYLNNVAKEWDALVEADYESVFPLIWRYKYLKVKELYQPSLIREAGIYSVNPLSPTRLDNFIEAIPKDIKYTNIHLNEQNQLAPKANFKLSNRDNYYLMLNNNQYDEISANYSSSLTQKIEKAYLSKFTATSNLKPEKIIDFYKKHTTNRKGIDKRYHGYLRIMYNVLHRGWGFASGILDSSGNILASAFFVYSHHKVMVLLSAASPEGVQKAADVFLIDMLLRTHAGKPLILDFNDDNEMALEFGAEQSIYQQLVIDKRKWGIF